MIADTEEYLWGITLTKDKQMVQWDPERGISDDDSVASKNLEHSSKGEYQLVVKQIILDSDAPSGEENVVAVDAMGYNSSVDMPIARLKNDSNIQCYVDLYFPDPPVKFLLKKGSGPVHLIGNFSIGSLGDDDDEEEEDIEDELDEEELRALKEEEEAASKMKKRKPAKNETDVKHPQKKRKVVNENDDEDGDADVSMTEDETSKKKPKGKAKTPAKKSTPSKKK